MLSNRIAEKLRTLKTPFFLYDMDLLRQTLEEVRSFSNKYRYDIHYAIKANFDERILRCIHSYGLGVDCVSGNEIRKAIEIGFSPNQIVYAGVGKTDKEILFALETEIFAFNCESRQELEVINELAAKMGKTPNVALRINPDVNPSTHEYISTGHADSKFGISYKEVDEVISQLSTLKNLNIVGLHFHIGSQITDMESFRKLCLRANSTYKWFTERGFKLSHINLGGGLGVNYDNPDSEPVVDFKEYFSIFKENLDIDPNVKIHFELGRSIVAQCGELITRVLYTKTSAVGNEYAIVDASMTELIRPSLYKAHHKIALISEKRSAEKEYTIGGPVCESSDIFAKNLKIEELQRGDMLSIQSAGAYGASMASRYNLRDLPSAIYSDDLK